MTLVIVAGNGRGVDGVPLVRGVVPLIVAPAATLTDPEHRLRRGAHGPHDWVHAPDPWRLTRSRRGPMVATQSQAPGPSSVARSARWIGSHTMARMAFSSAEAHIVVCSDGYFDVYPPVVRSDGDKPAYRGSLAELGTGIRGTNGRLGVRPGSAALAYAVTAWAAVNGESAVNGELGRGRDGTQVEA